MDTRRVKWLEERTESTPMDPLILALLGVIVALVGLIAGTLDSWIPGMNLNHGFSFMAKFAEYLGFGLALGGLWWESVKDMGGESGTIAVWSTVLLSGGAGAVLVILGAVLMNRNQTP